MIRADPGFGYTLHEQQTVGLVAHDHEARAGKEQAGGLHRQELTTHGVRADSLSELGDEDQLEAGLLGKFGEGAFRRIDVEVETGFLIGGESKREQHRH